jgi:hypothetical protein
MCLYGRCEEKVKFKDVRRVIKRRVQLLDLHKFNC